MKSCQRQLLARFKAGVLEALEPRSPRPKSNPRALTTELRGQYGTSFSTLTDNGLVYTGRFVEGKIERFHQTLKKWLPKQEAAKDLKELQRQLDEFRAIYNTRRPHKPLEM